MIKNEYIITNNRFNRDLDYKIYRMVFSVI